jgi:uncharacterized protein (TIGR03435 family)
VVMGRCGRDDRKLLTAAAGGIAILMPMMLLVAGRPLPAQVAATPAPVVLTQKPAETAAVPFSFDVATFKPTAPDRSYFGGGFDASGYHLTNYTFAGVVFSAYFSLNPSKSRGHETIGMPAWAYKEFYDVVAHVDEASAPEWLKLSPTQRQEPGRLMLQKLLADRCKLVAHTVPTQVDGFALVVGRGGSRLIPSKPGATYPADAKSLGDGAKIVSSSPRGYSTMNFFNASVEQLAELLSMQWDIRDQTALTGRYNFTIRRLEPVDADGKRIADPQPYDLWDISSTGLEIKRAKLPTENLVIDHVERPSAN